MHQDYIAFGCHTETTLIMETTVLTTVQGILPWKTTLLH